MTQSPISVIPLLPVPIAPHRVHALLGLPAVQMPLYPAPERDSIDGPLRRIAARTGGPLVFQQHRPFGVKQQSFVKQTVSYTPSEAASCRMSIGDLQTRGQQDVSQAVIDEGKELWGKH